MVQKYKYRLKFVPEALTEWKKLDGSIKEPLKKLLEKRLDEPCMPGAKLHGSLQHCYKIKLLKQGYRLVYTVENDELVVLVLSVDKREDSVAYAAALSRLLKNRS
ncbi:type II toxin-antitoxin system RelE family toxin [Chitinimonas sp. PSY-7]|uniref:type II toxin-antitoxin system mRNA interferase toxin, RelE/StbE family n=1 Tax=Chitinimonas sp. PSY-7 TaxID=3459088 RepID=UPI00404036E7